MKSVPDPRHRPLRDILIYGVSGGILIAFLRIMEYRLLILEHSVQIYAALVAALFAAIGIWLGRTLVGRRREIVVETALPPGPFVRDEQRVGELGITPRELEVLGLIAAGMSNREIAKKLFVSENTVKTHSSRVLEKLGARRRTQAVQIGKASRLIP